MKALTPHVLNARTYVTDGQAGALLLIIPDTTPGQTSLNDFNRDAEEIARFLKNIFCNKTLRQLRDELARI